VSLKDDYGWTDYDITGDPNMLQSDYRKLVLYPKSILDQDVWKKREKAERIDK
jgi:hypothetical protein